MAFQFPRRLPADGSVLDYEDYAEGLEPFVQEAAGRLNEHNFRATMAGELPVERDFAWRTAHARVTAGMDDFRIRRAVIEANFDPDNVVLINPVDWTPVVTLQVFSREGGLARVIGGAQYYMTANPPETLGGVGWAENRRRRWTTYWAIRLDNAVNGETICGDLDDGEAPLFVERGYSGLLGGVKVDTLVRLPVGTSTVELVARSASKGVRMLPQNRQNETVEVVTSRELVVWELGR